MWPSKEQLRYHIKCACKKYRDYGGELRFYDILFDRFICDKRYKVKCEALSDNRYSGSGFIKVGNNRFYVTFTRRDFNQPWETCYLEEYRGY